MRILFYQVILFQIFILAKMYYFLIYFSIRAHAYKWQSIAINIDLLSIC